MSAATDENPTLGGIQSGVKGTTEAGAELEFTVNNRLYRTTATSRGEFNFSEVTFLSRGLNRYTLLSRDAVGNISEIDGIIISNHPPELTILTPQNGDFVGGKSEIKWRASDADQDPILFSVFYRPKNRNWITLADNLTAESLGFDVSGFAGGEYELRVAANDGLTEVSETVEKLFIDNVRPAVRLDIAGPVISGKTLPLFSGSASDDLSGIKFAEYSIDGATWFRGVIIKGYLQKEAAFVTRHPFELKDGEYEFGIRAVDAAGNISSPVFVKVRVDTFGPRVGSYVLSKDGFALLPEPYGFVVSGGSRLKLALSLEEDAAEASLKIEDREPELVKNRSTGLWEAEFEAPASGIVPFFVTARDGIGNEVRDKPIGSISAVRRGKVFFAAEGKEEGIGDAEISAFIYNEESKSWVEWPAEAYGAENPVNTDEKGEYELFLPSNRYQLLVRKVGFQRVRSEEFEILNPRFVNFDFELRPRAGFKGAIENILEYIQF